MNNTQQERFCNVYNIWDEETNLDAYVFLTKDASDDDVSKVVASAKETFAKARDYVLKRIASDAEPKSKTSVYYSIKFVSMKHFWEPLMGKYQNEPYFITATILNLDHRSDFCDPVVERMARRRKAWDEALIRIARDIGLPDNASPQEIYEAVKQNKVIATILKEGEKIGEAEKKNS